MLNIWYRSICLSLPLSPSLPSSRTYTMDMMAHRIVFTMIQTTDNRCVQVAREIVVLLHFYHAQHVTVIRHRIHTKLHGTIAALHYIYNVLDLISNTGIFMKWNFFNVHLAKERMGLWKTYEFQLSLTAHARTAITSVHKITHI